MVFPHLKPFLIVNQSQRCAWYSTLKEGFSFFVEPFWTKWHVLSWAPQVNWVLFKHISNPTMTFNSTDMGYSLYLSCKYGVAMNPRWPAQAKAGAWRSQAPA